MSDNDASKAAPPANGASEETQESIYARNRAIYDASVAQQSAASAAATGSSNNGNSNGAASTEKQARPREDEDEDAAATSPNGTTAPPVKKKLIRAGDLAAAASTSSATLTGSDGSLPSPAAPGAAPPTPSDAGSTVAPSSNTAGAGESMREKIARASRSASGTPFVAQVLYSPPPTTQPALSPTNNPSTGGTLSGSNLDQVIEVNALAFIAKNPQIDPNHVRQALKHSKGAFDQNFNTAIQLLMSSQSQQQQQQAPKQASPSLAQGAFSPAARYPGQQVNPTPPAPGQGHYPGQAPPNGAPAAQMRNYPGSKMSPPATAQQLHPHQMARPGAGSPPLVVGNQASAINGQSAAVLGGPSPQPGGGTGQIPMPSVPPPTIFVGTHPAIGFSALQILPEIQHKQYYQLAPNQQTDYSMQVFKSLPVEQQQELTAQWRRSEAIRQQWQLYYAQNPGLTIGPNGMPIQQHAGGPPGQIVIPPRGVAGGSNPYIPYAAQPPTNRQQTVQQRFPGQNPVFRVGASGAANGASGTEASTGDALPPNQSQYAWFHREQSRLLSEMSPEARQKFHELTQQEQYAYVVQSIQMKQDAAKRQAQQSQRQQQQKVMAATAKAARSGPTAQQQQVMAQAHAQAQAHKKKKKKNQNDSDDSEALGLHDDDTDDDRNDDDDVGDDGSEAEAERENQALEWFNTVKPEEIMEMTGKQDIASVL